MDERNPFNGRTLLHEAAACNYLSIAKMLLEDFGADVNSRTYLGKVRKKSERHTLLILLGLSTLRSALLSLPPLHFPGALSPRPLTLAPRHQETPLHLAVIWNLRPMVYLLLNHGADANIQSKYVFSLRSRTHQNGRRASETSISQFARACPVPLPSTFAHTFTRARFFFSINPRSLSLRSQVHVHSAALLPEKEHRSAAH